MSSRFAVICLVLLPIFSFSQSAPYKFIQRNSEAAPGSLSVVRADFNNDSIPDLATANQDENTVSVLLMNSSGTVRSRHDYAVGDSPMALAVADFNHDHKIDLVTTNADANDAHTISVLLGNGDGTLQSANFFSGGHLPFTMVSADFDGDGNFDVATGWLQVTSTDPDAKQPNQIQISYGDGKGGFSSKQTLNNVGEAEPAGARDRRMTKLAVGDFNHDGRPDLVFIEGERTTRILSGDIFMLLNDGKNHFVSQPPIATEESNDLTTADVNQDGFDDVVLVSFGCGTDDGCGDFEHFAVLVFLNSGNGTFTQKGAMGFGGDEFDDRWNSPSVADLNGDGLKDIAIFTLVGGRSFIGGEHDQLQFIVAFQQPDGTFVSQRILLDGRGFPTTGLLYDQDREGRIDVAFLTGGGKLVTLMNTTPGRQCLISDGFRKLRICLPLPQSPGINSPVQIMASTNDTIPIEAIKIYVDGVAKLSTTDDVVNTRLNIIPGVHDIVVKAWDRSGPFFDTLHVNVMNRCSFPGVNRTVQVCSATNGFVSSPVPIQANVTNSEAVNAIQVYVDGVIKFTSQRFARTVDTSLPMASGKHRVTVKAWDIGGPFSQTYTVTVQ